MVEVSGRTGDDDVVFIHLVKSRNVLVDDSFGEGELVPAFLLEKLIPHSVTELASDQCTDGIVSAVDIVNDLISRESAFPVFVIDGANADVSVVLFKGEKKMLVHVGLDPVVGIYKADVFAARGLKT